MRRLVYGFQLMSFLTCAASIEYCGPALAQYSQTDSRFSREECPQGREIRARKAYPASMTDCEVLYADTATENRRLQRAPTTASETSPAVQAPPVHVYTNRQVDAIRMTTFSALAGEYCRDVIENGAAGGELINAGIQLSDFGTAEYERIRKDARGFLTGINSAARCGEIWRVLGPGGTYGRQLVRARLPSDPPYKWNPLRDD